MVGKTEDSPTQLLVRWRGGDLASRDKLFACLYPSLERAARKLLSGERQISIAPADLVHDVVLRMVPESEPRWMDRVHFLAFASRVMRQVMVDHVRAKSANKRSHKKVTLLPDLLPPSETDFSDLHEHLLRLSAIDSDKADIVEMRFFGGMTIDEIAAVQGKSPATVKNHWAIARAWLINALDS